MGIRADCTFELQNVMDTAAPGGYFCVKKSGTLGEKCERTCSFAKLSFGVNFSN